jgi:hypothetical protein
MAERWLDSLDEESITEGIDPAIARGELDQASADAAAAAAAAGDAHPWGAVRFGGCPGLSRGSAPALRRPVWSSTPTRTDQARSEDQ